MKSSQLTGQMVWLGWRRHAARDMLAYTRNTVLVSELILSPRPPQNRYQHILRCHWEINGRGNKFLFSFTVKKSKKIWVYCSRSLPGGMEELLGFSRRVFLFLKTHYKSLLESEFTATVKGGGRKNSASQMTMRSPASSIDLVMMEARGSWKGMYETVCPQSFFPSSCCGWDPSVYRGMQPTQGQNVLLMFWGRLGSRRGKWATERSQDQLPTK